MNTNVSGFFPFLCENPNCQTQYDQAGFIEVLNRRGLVYAECGESIYIGITCEKCNWTTIKSFSKGQQVIDLRRLIIIPDYLQEYEIAQQIIEFESPNIGPENIKARSWGGMAISILHSSRTDSSLSSSGRSISLR